ncbi:MAG: transcriptional repressor [Anaerolineales bacterium]|nr:transcriptional repressor [Anaerolineales bacterium]
MNQGEVFELLRAAGYRLTGPRRQLVETLLAAEGPLTAEALHQLVRPAGLNLSTVYRNLASFCDLGWLEAVPGLGGERFYQVRQPQSSSFSILCLDCGRLNAVTGMSEAGLSEAVREHGFKPDDLRVTLAAHCGHVCEHKPG